MRSSFYEEQIYGGKAPHQVAEFTIGIPDRTESGKGTNIDPIVRNHCAWRSNGFKLTKVEPTENGDPTDLERESNSSSSTAKGFDVEQKPRVASNLENLNKLDENCYPEYATTIPDRKIEPKTKYNLLSSSKDGYGSPGATQNQTQYRTSLFFVPKSPQSSSPVIWGNGSGIIKHTRSETSNDLRGQHPTQDSHITANFIPSFDSQIFPQPFNIHANFKKDFNANALSDETKITFQGPGRYLEEKPYYQVMPAPRKMQIDPVVNGVHDPFEHLRITPAHTPSPLMVKRNDFNQVVVDIKPRELNDVDKRQNVSQWIEIGTLGESLTSKLEADSEHEDNESNFVLSQLDYEDIMDGDSLVNINRVTITRELSDDCQIDSARTMQQRNELYWSENRYHPDYLPARRIAFDAIPEESSTPGSTRTSLKSNSQLNASSVAIEEPNAKLVEIAVSGNERSADKHHVMNGNKKDDKLGGHDKVISTYTSKQPRTPTEFELKSQLSQLYEHEQRSDQPSVKPKSKIPPPTAPKPRTHDYWNAYFDRRGLSPAQSDMSKNGTFPRTRMIHGGKLSQDQIKLETYTSDSVEQSEDALPCVKHLTAYFTDLINKHIGPERPRSACQFRSPNRGPLSNAREVNEDHCRKINAVEELRNRSFTSDHIARGLKPKNPVNDGSTDDYYPYIRPASAPRLKTEFERQENAKQ